MSFPFAASNDASPNPQHKEIRLKIVMQKSCFSTFKIIKHVSCLNLKDTLAGPLLQMQFVWLSIVKTFILHCSQDLKVSKNTKYVTKNSTEMCIT